MCSQILFQLISTVQEYITYIKKHGLYRGNPVYLDTYEWLRMYLLSGNTGASVKRWHPEYNNMDRFAAIGYIANFKRNFKPEDLKFVPLVDTKDACSWFIDSYWFEMVIAAGFWTPPRVIGSAARSAVGSSALPSASSGASSAIRSRLIAGGPALFSGCEAAIVRRVEVLQEYEVPIVGYNQAEIEAARKANSRVASAFIPNTSIPNVTEKDWIFIMWSEVSVLDFIKNNPIAEMPSYMSAADPIETEMKNITLAQCINKASSEVEWMKLIEEVRDHNFAAKENALNRLARKNKWPLDGPQYSEQHQLITEEREREETDLNEQAANWIEARNTDPNFYVVQVEYWKRKKGDEVINLENFWGPFQAHTLSEPRGAPSTWYLMRGLITIDFVFCVLPMAIPTDAPRPNEMSVDTATRKIAVKYDRVGGYFPYLRGSRADKIRAAPARSAAPPSRRQDLPGGSAAARRNMAVQRDPKPSLTFKEARQQAVAKKMKKISDGLNGGGDDKHQTKQRTQRTQSKGPSASASKKRPGPRAGQDRQPPVSGPVALGNSTVQVQALATHASGRTAPNQETTTTATNKRRKTTKMERIQSDSEDDSMDISSLSESSDAQRPTRPSGPGDTEPPPTATSTTTRKQLPPRSARPVSFREVIEQAEEPESSESDVCPPQTSVPGVRPPSDIRSLPESDSAMDRHKSTGPGTKSIQQTGIRIIAVAEGSIAIAKPADEEVATHNNQRFWVCRIKQVAGADQVHSVQWLYSHNSEEFGKYTPRAGDRGRYELPAEAVKYAFGALNASNKRIPRSHAKKIADIFGIELPDHA